jgi:ribosomal-protein-alanine N-acetyltransferase
MLSPAEATLRTEHLLLQPLMQRHRADLLRLYTDPFVANAMFGKTTIDDDEFDQKFVAHLKHWEDRGFGFWAVYACSSEDGQGAFIGRCGIQHLDDPGIPELGYCFFRSSAGQGLGVEAAQAVISFGFQHLGLDRLAGVIQLSNARALRAAEKIGFKHITNKQVRGAIQAYLEIRAIDRG